MNKLYKLTDQNDQTYNKCQWGPGVTHNTSGEGELCGPGFTHWYTHPLLAVLLNPLHCNFDLATAHLWEGRGTVEKNDCGSKVGCRNGRTLHRIPMPQITPEQVARFAILCGKKICANPLWNKWADAWLSGEDRSPEAAEAAAEAAAGAARAAWAAEAAAWAAEAAAEAAGAAAWAAEAAAEAAAWAAGAAKFDLVTIAKEACK